MLRLFKNSHWEPKPETRSGPDCAKRSADVLVTLVKAALPTCRHIMSSLVVLILTEKASPAVIVQGNNLSVLTFCFGELAISVKMAAV